MNILIVAPLKDWSKHLVLQLGGIRYIILLCHSKNVLNGIQIKGSAITFNCTPQYLIKLRKQCQYLKTMQNYVCSGVVDISQSDFQHNIYWFWMWQWQHGTWVRLALSVLYSNNCQRIKSEICKIYEFLFFIEKTKYLSIYRCQMITIDITIS